MRYYLKIFFLGFLCIIFFHSHSQSVDSAYLIYQKQFIELSTTRSITVNEAQEVLRKFNENKIGSNHDMAKLLKSLYPKDQGIGVLLYLYNRDTLKRTFFAPGKIIEEISIPIKAEKMFALSEALQNALGLESLTANRKPVERGVSIKSVKNTKPAIKLDSIIAILTKLLLPKSFTTEYRHLIIIPSLNIGTLPFHILKPYNDNSFLIDKCSFTVAPTLIDFVALRMKVAKILAGEGFRSNINNLLTTEYEGYMGDDVRWDFENGVFISNPAYPKNGKYYFPNLPGAEKEIDSVSRYYKSAVVFKGKAATKTEIIQAMNGKEIAYFATHGISSSDNPKDNSFVVLSGDDPYLTSKQIMDLRLNRSYKMPELVVLSACQTGLGKSMEAGISGSLARSFILAGSNHVITSLWSVDDEATGYMMRRFIYHLKGSHLFTPSEPLRLAILDTKKHFPNPAHWASFILLGIDY